MADKERGLGEYNVELSDEALEQLSIMSGNDARTALNALEMAAMTTPADAEGKRKITLETVEDAFQHRALQYDRAGEQHYDIISALHKCMRDSDPDASLYWLGRMIESGEDPLYIIRRVIRFATEDIGLADPQALVVAVAAQQAVHFLGMPEGNLSLAEAVVYMATAPKSNSLYSGYSKVQYEIKHGSNEPVPLNLRNAVTNLMKDIGYGKGYKYAHNFEGHYVEQQHLPDSMKGKHFYTPGELGYERQIAARMKELKMKRVPPEKE
jgi:putative ATPase